MEEVAAAGMKILDGRPVVFDGMEFLLDPVDRFPATQAAADTADGMDLIQAVAQSSVAEQAWRELDGGAGEAGSAVGDIRGRDEESPDGEVDSKRPRKPPATSQASGIRGDPKAPGWERRVRIGDAPEERLICADRMGALEKLVQDYAENPTDSVVKPELGTSFDSLNEAYDFYNLYSWEHGFGVRVKIGSVPPDRPLCPGRMGALERSVRSYAENPSDSVIKRELGTSFHLGRHMIFTICIPGRMDSVRYIRAG